MVALTLDLGDNNVILPKCFVLYAPNNMLTALTVAL